MSKGNPGSYRIGSTQDRQKPLQYEIGKSMGAVRHGDVPAPRAVAKSRAFDCSSTAL